jgi:hypothetical protein
MEYFRLRFQYSYAALAWQVITDLWLQPSVHMDATHEDRSPFFLTSVQTLELIRQADSIFKTEENILNIEGPTKVFGDIHGMAQSFQTIYSRLLIWIDLLLFQVNLMTCVASSKRLGRQTITSVTLKRILMSFSATLLIVVVTVLRLDSFFNFSVSNFQILT